MVIRRGRWTGPKGRTEAADFRHAAVFHERHAPEPRCRGSSPQTAQPRRIEHQPIGPDAGIDQTIQPPAFRKPVEPVPSDRERPVWPWSVEIDIAVQCEMQIVCSPGTIRNCAPSSTGRILARLHIELHDAVHVIGDQHASVSADLETVGPAVIFRDERPCTVGRDPERSARTGCRRYRDCRRRRNEGPSMKQSVGCPGRLASAQSRAHAFAPEVNRASAEKHLGFDKSGRSVEIHQSRGLPVKDELHHKAARSRRRCHPIAWGPRDKAMPDTR